MGAVYIAIDLKSFYASVECVERGLDPIDTNLVVADKERTEKTICLAVSAGLKSFGLPGRPRLFEVVQEVKHINALRRGAAAGGSFSGSSYKVSELNKDPSLELDYITATPRMGLYMQYSTRIYSIYLKYVAPEDIHVYSCDEVFIDASRYLELYRLDAHEFARRMIREIMDETGITATAGIGTNLFLCKVAMDIVAKHISPDKDGVRIAELDERRFREELWSHKPITDFWRVGRGTAKKLYSLGLETMGDVARYSEIGEKQLYKIFGVNAELIIDHAWGWEPCTIADIRSFRPVTNSLSSGQVLSRPYDNEEGLIIVKEMTELLSLDLVRKSVLTDQLTLTINYEAFTDPKTADGFKGEIRADRYGRPAPVHAHGTANLPCYTASTRLMTDAISSLYKRITDPGLKIRRVNVCACRIMNEGEAEKENETEYEQLDLFTDYEALKKQHEEEDMLLKKEKALQLATLKIKDKFGRNAIIKGTDLMEGATTIERNRFIGGHKA